MSALGRHRMVGVCLAAGALLMAPIALVAATLETGRTIHVPDNCRIVTPDDRRATLADLKVGDVVQIRYQNANGTLVADRIVVRSSLASTRHDESPKPGDETPPPPPPPKPGNETVRAVITAIKLQAKTITIAGKAGHKSG